ncbi:MAG: formimidoylglutamase [Rickettsiales bacterium]|nr:formimidoylglutamase [Rickettsiales bacterium]
MTYKKSLKISGRIDGTDESVLRFHQVINHIDLEKDEIHFNENESGIVFLEFNVDEGVRRNKGRIGAAQGGIAISEALANFPINFSNNYKFFHGGIITCDDGNLEKSQENLGFYVEKIIKSKALPIVFGGGHEITYGNYLGIKNFAKKSKIGIINFDAHFDLRPVEKEIGATSGTGFWQISEDMEKNNESFNYLALGIQKFSNTKFLFNLANQLGVKYVFGDEFNYENKNNLLKIIAEFIAKNDYIYLTICMDVFAASFAPGVSAPSPNGILPDFIFKSCFDLITKSKKLISLDFAETNPKFDVDARTSKSAASLVFRALGNLK